MTDFYGGRTESYIYELLDNQDRVLGKLDNVTGGKLRMSSSAIVRGSGAIELVTNNDIDMLTNRVRVSYVWEGGIVPLITALPSIPAENHGLHRTLSVELKDKLAILENDSFGYSYSLVEGTNVIDAVKDILWSAGQDAVIEPSTMVTGNRVWDATVSKLRIINDLLASANYFALYADGLGRLRANKYIEPYARPVMWQFTDEDGQGTYLPEFSRNYDPYSVPNKYICIGKSEGDVEASVEEAVDYNSPYGFLARGYWVTRVDTDVEGDLAAVANRRLIDARQVYETLDVEHPYLPFTINGHENRVTFSNKGRSWNAVCQSQEWDLSPGGLIKSDLRILT